MRTVASLLLAAVAAAALSGCSSTIKPNYISTNPELQRIGGSKPEDTGPDLVNMGSYCLEVTERWKEDGETPDGQKIWSKNTQRKSVPCK